MKTTKILAVVLGLFLMGNVNVALAQETERNDSIYGLEGSILGNMINFSFYSTYDMNNAKTIQLSSYDETSNEQLKSLVLYLMSDLNFGNFTFPSSGICEKVTDDIYKINVEVPLKLLVVENKPVRIELFVEGEGFGSPSDNLKSGNIGRSNILTFFFNPTTTSLMELEVDRNYTYKYFLLSGKESKEIPIGIPFIQMTYDDNVFIYSNKCLIHK